MSLAYENPLDSAVPKCIPPLIQIWKGLRHLLNFHLALFLVPTLALRGLADLSVSMSVGSIGEMEEGRSVFCPGTIL